MPKTTETEIRAVCLPVESRAAKGAETGTAVGYAALFNSEADIGGYMTEVFLPGAFTESLKSEDVRAYFDHDRGRVLGRMSAGTLRLREDEKGLAVEIDLPDTSDGRDVRELVERGDITGMSIGFQVLHDEWDETVDPPKRTIHEARLREASIVSEPAYGDTSVAMRSLEEARGDQKKQNFSAAAKRLRRKMDLDLRIKSTA